MSSVLFYDPHSRHSSQVDPDILFLRCSQCLYQALTLNNPVRKLVYLCCDDKSAMIDELLRRRENVLIYLCRRHGGRETNPTYNKNVRDDVAFNFDSGWEFIGRSHLMMACVDNQNKVQAHDELEKMIAIKRSMNILHPVIPVINQQGNAPNNQIIDSVENE